MKRYTLSVVISKMQIKATVRYHYTLLRMAKIKKWTISSSDKNVEQLEFSYKHCWWACGVTCRMTTSLTISYRLNKHLAHDAAISLLGIYSRE